MSRQPRSRRALAACLVGLVLAGLVTAVMPPAAAEFETSRAAAKKPAFSQTKTLTRFFLDADGSKYEFPSNTVTVTASETRNLRGRQRIEIAWSGAQPSGGRAANPYGENGLQQEYPVVVMQCRGVDDPGLPPTKQLRPETCWTVSVAQRSQVVKTASEATWTRDALADPEDTGRVSGLDPFPTEEQCPGADQEIYFTRITPFVAADGRVFAACDSANMPPEAAVCAAFPAAEIAAFSDETGSGSVQFEVRSDVENESLGCNNKVACSIVVIPINGISCAQPSSPPSLSDNACRRGGQFPPGSSNFTNAGADQAVSPALWWSASNWANRFSIPITFGLPPDTCDVLDPRPPTGFFGSELLAQASVQWAPAYCLSKKRFKFQHNQMSDAAGWNLMEGGRAPAALVSSEQEKRGSDPVGYAPTALTGFGIGYNIDLPDNAGEFTRLRLNARLVAKLMTQSYLGSALGRGHPGIGDNPLALMNDPEFIALNPGLSQITQEAGATMLSLSNASDVIEQLTAWIAADKEAMAFVNGKADPWGMKVNPSYRKLDLPRQEWPLLDTYIPETENECRQANPSVYFTQLAAPVTTLRKVAESLLDGHPNVQTRCEFDVGTGTFRIGRIERQTYGARFMLGLVSLGDLDRYGLRAAALETKKGSFVAPTESSLLAATALSEQAKPMAPFELDQAEVRKSTKAYPGTMVVYTGTRLANLPAADAEKVAQFIRISTSEGQKPGNGNGELPGGFVPIRSTGPTAELHSAAQKVATAVEKQAPAKAPAPSASPSSSPAPAAGAPVPGAPAVDGVPAGPAPQEPVAAAPTAAASPEPIAMPETRAVTSDWGGRLLPTLLLLGLLGFALASGVRFLVPPPKAPQR